MTPTIAAFRITNLIEGLLDDMKLSQEQLSNIEPFFSYRLDANRKVGIVVELKFPSNASSPGTHAVHAASPTDGTPDAA